MMLLEWVYASLVAGAAVSVMILTIIVVVGTFIMIIVKEDK